MQRRLGVQTCSKEEIMKKWFARASPGGGTLIGPAEGWFGHEGMGLIGPREIIKWDPYFGHSPGGGWIGCSLAEIVRI